MDLIPAFDYAIEDEIEGRTQRLSALLDEIFANKYSDVDKNKLSIHIEQQYNNYDVCRKTTVLFILGKIDGEAACRVAKNNIENSYQQFRFHGSHLHSMIASILRFDGPSISTSSIEHDRNMRLAYALINGKEIVDGDFMPPKV